MRLCERRGDAVFRTRGLRLKHFAVVGLFALALAAPASAFAAPTVVSLTFDDGLSNQYGLRTVLSQHAMHATFYINSDHIGSSSTYMTWPQLSDLASDGNEIAGHSLDHVDLTSVTTTEAQRQVCADRQAIIAAGFLVTDFAYPYGAENPSIDAIVQGCGYSSGRRSWGDCAIGTLPENCTDPVAEAIPPHNIWATGTLASIRAWNTLADLEGAVTRAESTGGGWVTFVFHNFCDGCDPSGYSTSPAILSAFMDWLAPRAATGTYVRTVRDVVSDATAPASSIACNGAVCSSSAYAPPVSVSLSATDAGSGVAAIRYTTDGSTPSATSSLYTAPFSVSTTTTVKYRAWDVDGNVEATESQLIQMDTTPPTSSIACNGAACSSSVYAAPVSVSLSATDAGSGVAAIRYTTDGSTPTASSSLYTAPFSVSTTTTVEYRAWDVAGNVEATKSQLIQVDTFAPTVSIASPSGGATVTGNVKIIAAPADAQTGVASVKFYVDGVLVGTSTSAPWQFAWNTKKSTKGTHVLTVVATDRAGNSTTSAPVSVTVR
jgi:peptidoglycan/xylan/chitin deacetylase (PgdA/CDA1 family)